MRTYLPIIALIALLNACGLETEPNPDSQSASGNGGYSGGGSGGSDAGDAGGEGGHSGGGSGGTSGGSGGTSGGQGGDSAVSDCDDDGDCTATLPQCSPQGTCISCTSSDACEDRGQLEHCETKLGSDHRGQCVACLKDADCQGSDDGDYCLNNTCVPCKADSDCTDLEKPECGADGQCTGCTSNGACEGRDGTEVCITDAGPKRGHCVACTENAHCTSTENPECKPTNLCGACLNDDACTGRDGHERCNRRAATETFGQCVACTGETEADDCDGKSCNQATGECTDVTVGDLNPCESCEADSQCGDGTKCVKHMLGETDLGYFCFYSYAANDGCSDTRPGIKPYSQTLPNTLSIDSVADAQKASYCLPVTSCTAYVNATDFMGSASPKTCDNDNDCGVAGSADGAYCIPETFMTEAVRHKCSYACSNSSDCAAAGFDTCPGSGLKFCQP